MEHQSKLKHSSTVIKLVKQVMFYALPRSHVQPTQLLDISGITKV